MAEVVDETASIMQDNLTRLLANHQDLEALADKSENLLMQVARKLHDAPADTRPAHSQPGVPARSRTSCTAPLAACGCTNAATTAG